MDKDKWYKLSWARQLGNIGSELTRARLSEEKKDEAGRKNSLIRALELLDLTISDQRWIKKLKELTRFREVIADWFCQTHAYNISHKILEKYCMHFYLNELRIKKL